ncbi:MAG: SRPBCC domain-containing protein [Terriglobia bacterium]
MKRASEGDEFARIGSEAVKAKTGRTWAEWFKLLDATGARKFSHKEIATLLYKKHKLPAWWSQMVTVGYEQARGLRQKHQKPEGFEISSSRTLDVPAAKAFAAWLDESVRRRWLKNFAFTVRKATPHKSLRITWVDGKTSVSVNFYPKGDGKCQVAAQHSKLADAKQAARMKKYWAEQLDKLKEVSSRQ